MPYIRWHVIEQQVEQLDDSWVRNVGHDHVSDQRECHFIVANFDARLDGEEVHILKAHQYNLSSYSLQGKT